MDNETKQENPMYNSFATTFKKLVSQEDETSEHNQISDTDFFLGGVISL